MTRGPRRYIYFQAVWICGAIIGFSLLDLLSVRTFAVSVLVGLLVGSVFISPRATVRPPWRRRLDRLLFLCTIAFGLIVVIRLGLILYRTL